MWTHSSIWSEHLPYKRKVPGSIPGGSTISFKSRKVNMDFKNLKIGLDLHGVIDRNPQLFSDLTHKFANDFFIITGEEITKKLFKEIDSYRIHYKQENVFSITSFHKHLGTPMTYLNHDPTQPHIDDEIWNRTKSVICKFLKLDYMIDDSKVYGKYFTKEYGVNTQYIYYNENYSSQLMEFLKSFSIVR